MAYAALATSSVAVLVLSLHTIQALLMGGMFVMVSPLCQPGWTCLAIVLACWTQGEMWPGSDSDVAPASPALQRASCAALPHACHSGQLLQA